MIERAKPARMRQHDEVAVPLVMFQWSRFGFECHIFGGEVDNANLQTALRSQSDPTSLMLRFRPDRVFVRPGLRSLLCEVKSEGGRQPNFAIEVDSYLAAKVWNATQGHVVYAFIDLQTEAVSCCWADSIPTPTRVLMPARWDREANRERLERELPEAHLVDFDRTCGSGTPFFTISKRAAYLQPMDEFVKVEILGEKPEPQVIREAKKWQGQSALVLGL
jgi:hypothetical protein